VRVRVRVSLLEARLRVRLLPLAHRDGDVPARLLREAELPAQDRVRVRVRVRVRARVRVRVRVRVGNSPNPNQLPAELLDLRAGVDAREQHEEERRGRRAVLESLAHREGRLLDVPA